MSQVQIISWPDTARETTFKQWLHDLVPSYHLDMDSLRPASADASFRRYFRVDSIPSDPENSNSSYIVMDAPPKDEDCTAFVKVAKLFDSAGIPAATVLEWDEANGFMLLPDLGSYTMLERINAGDQPEPYFLDAIELLTQWQLASAPDQLPAYSKALLEREVQLFPTWYVAGHRQHIISEKDQAMLGNTFATLIENNLSSPSVYVHRDFMPRNLVVSSQNSLSVLDFQDATYGPITYDIACLLKDAFISWEEEFVLDFTIRYWEKARQAGLPVGDDFGAFYKQVEWMGLQRHLKVAGIFARLTLRDGKAKYLEDAPRFIHYIRHTASRYREFKPLLHFIDKLEQTEMTNAFSFGRL